MLIFAAESDIIRVWFWLWVHDFLFYSVWLVAALHYLVCAVLMTFTVKKFVKGHLAAAVGCFYWLQLRLANMIFFGCSQGWLIWWLTVAMAAETCYKLFLFTVLVLWIHELQTKAGWNNNTFTCWDENNVNKACLHL